MVARRYARVFWFPAVALLLTLEGAPSRASAAGTEASAVPFNLEADGIITVQATIDEDGPFRLLLDTGSNRSAVSMRVARRLRLPAVARAAQMTAAGNSGTDVVRLEALTLGAVTRRGLPVAVLDDAGCAALGAEVDGILGQDFLLDQTYTLDYTHRRLLWEIASSSSAETTRLTLKEEEGRWLVALPQDADGTGTLWFVPDSGAANLTVFDRGTPMALALRPLPCCAMLQTANGSQEMRVVLVDRLRVGSLVIQHRPAVVVDRRAPDAPAGDGLLPLSIFGSVSFEPKARVLLVRAR